jgi:hypothetical protein
LPICLSQLLQVTIKIRINCPGHAFASILWNMA